MGSSVELDQDAELVVAKIPDCTVLRAAVLTLGRRQLVATLDIAQVCEFQSRLGACSYIAE
ncbi:hypothetical protein MLP_47000 [Microlunatus phosphovorus NM-1]|uniref:Uncharacterized protein n=1 Tax=Microlunatus phosphovorus (strain ATCC 700054 / DSM 10555 / JCM 9379 / NBRC 101784 / NCIMB 13414 / VKM Ac-1990 / NM-1) TaxID=1032480 RepID=F5XEG6_MICPN|nr:hypothetical protein MLP_47000 [Microlunatus phosphovorus NM-1]